MHKYTAKVSWKRNGAVFTDIKYSRGHEWSFDGGISVPASSSPLFVRPPLSVLEAIDPEEALIAAASSCHMLYFLYFAAKKGFVVDSFIDNAEGLVEKNERGKQVLTRITLKPQITYSGTKTPNAEELAELHHHAHDECIIANSINSEVVIESI
jgi:organic hydroperoxide reductase OsmC/OhrA